MNFLEDAGVSDYDKEKLLKKDWSDKTYIMTSDVPFYKAISGADAGYIDPTGFGDAIESYCDDDVWKFDIEYRKQTFHLMISEQYRLAQKGHIVACKGGGDTGLVEYFKYQCVDGTDNFVIIWRTMKWKDSWCIAVVQSKELKSLISVIGGHLTIFNSNKFYCQSDGSNPTTLKCDLNEILDNEMINRIMDNAVDDDPYLFINDYNSD